MLPRLARTDIADDIEWVQIPRETYMHFARGREWLRGFLVGALVGFALTSIGAWVFSKWVVWWLV